MVIALEQHSTTLPVVSPCLAGHNYGIQLFELNGEGKLILAPLRAQPSALVERAAAPCPAGICLQEHIGSQGPFVQQEEGFFSVDRQGVSPPFQVFSSGVWHQ